jgi:hypothetical protein
VFFTESGSRNFAESGSGSSLLKFEEKEEKFIKKRPIALLTPPTKDIETPGGSLQLNRELRIR